MKERPKVLMSFRMPPDLLENFSKLVELIHLTKTEVINEIVDQFCNKIAGRLNDLKEQ